MAAPSDAVRRFAEEPEGELSEPQAPEGRVQTASFILILSAARTQSNVGRVRTTEARLDETIAEVRGLLRERGYTRVTWNVGPSSRPVGLADMLAARGFVPATRPPFEPEAFSMALVQAPAELATDVEARLARDYDEYLEALRVAMEAFEVPADGVAGWIAAAPALWKQQDGVNRMTLIARRRGRPIGFAFAAGGPNGLLLCGSGVLPAERGHGAYRALVAARWKIAVALGRPALVIHAGAMSHPIAARAGFETVCRLEILEDPHLIPPEAAQG